MLADKDEATIDALQFNGRVMGCTKIVHGLMKVVQGTDEESLEVGSNNLEERTE